MDNQHRKISGYRELSAEDIELMNRIKQKGAELLELQEELVNRLQTDVCYKSEMAMRSLDDAGEAAVGLDINTADTDECVEWRRFQKAQPSRWAQIGRTDIETGLMALVRAVAQPG